MKLSRLFRKLAGLHTLVMADQLPHELRIVSCNVSRSDAVVSVACIADLIRR